MFVALQLLEPHAGADLMAASDQLQRVSVGERVAEGGLVGSDRTAACGETAATLQGAATDAEAVSYTHLDVYKRQLLRMTFSFLGEKRALNEPVCCEAQHNLSLIHI